MKWFAPMVIGALCGWIISSVTDEVAIAMASGAAIGVLATIALFGTDPVRAVVRVAGAMAIGSLAGWLVALLTGTLGIAMAIGSAIGAVATIAVAANERPFRSLLRVVGAMGIGFLVGWGVGSLVGDHRVGMALAIPLGLVLLTLTASSVTKRRHRPF